MRDAKWGAVAFALGAGSLLLGMVLIAGSAGSNDGSPIGWFLVAAGIFALLAMLGIVSGAFRD